MMVFLIIAISILTMTEFQMLSKPMEELNQPDMIVPPAVLLVPMVIAMD